MMFEYTHIHIKAQLSTLAMLLPNYPCLIESLVTKEMAQYKKIIVHMQGKVYNIDIIFCLQ